MKRAFCLIGVFVMAGFVLAGPVQEKKPPSAAEIAKAQQATDLLQATLFAALLQEFSETTPENAPGVFNPLAWYSTTKIRICGSWARGSLSAITTYPGILSRNEHWRTPLRVNRPRMSKRWKANGSIGVLFH
jgi:hypothetical protein